MVILISQLFTDAKQLIEAAQSNDKERLLQLLISGKSAKLADDKGRTALHVACAKGLPDIGNAGLRFVIMDVVCWIFYSNHYTLSLFHHFIP